MLESRGQLGLQSGFLPRPTARFVCVVASNTHKHTAEKAPLHFTDVCVRVIEGTHDGEAPPLSVNGTYQWDEEPCPSVTEHVGPKVTRSKGPPSIY